MSSQYDMPYVIKHLRSLCKNEFSNHIELGAIHQEDKKDPSSHAHSKSEQITQLPL